MILDGGLRRCYSVHQVHWMQQLVQALQLPPQRPGLVLVVPS